MQPKQPEQPRATSTFTGHVSAFSGGKSPVPSGVPLLSLSEVKTEELRMLVKFRDFCGRHGLGLVLCGGTLLGAVRHKGFIPWDDDIDVGLPRPDYERLKGLKDELYAEEGLALVPHGRVGLETTPLLKVLDPGIRAYEGDAVDAGFLWLDVLAIDGLPEGDVSGLYAKVNRYKSIYFWPLFRYGVGKSRLRGLAKVPLKFLVDVFRLDVWAAERIDALAKSTPYGSTPYVGVLTWNRYGIGERIHYEAFRERVPVEFEGEEFSTMSNWDEYLTGIYGDYMTPPPPEKRESHALVAWRAEGADAK